MNIYKVETVLIVGAIVLTVITLAIHLKHGGK